jgi:excisionase family DNA binding protein
MPEKFYSVKETCELLGVSRMTLWEMRRDGEIEFTRICRLAD